MVREGEKYVQKLILDEPTNVSALCRATRDEDAAAAGASST